MLFIVTKLIHIKYGYENELLYELKQYYPSPGTNGCINIEFSHVHRTNDKAEYMIRMLWKTQQDYHAWLSQKEGNETWKHKVRGYILSSKSNATYVH
jgi:heme-degrading monooxygenase HmoA